MEKITMTEYLKNSRKSFRYLGEDIADDYAPGLIGGIKASKDAISTAKNNYRKVSPLRMMSTLVNKSPIIRDVGEIGGKLFAGVKKGTFYKRDDFDFGSGINFDVGGDFYSDSDIDISDEDASWEATGEAYDGSDDVGAEATAVAGAGVANAVVGSAQAGATMTIEAMKAMHADRQLVLTGILNAGEDTKELVRGLSESYLGAEENRGKFYSASIQYYQDSVGMLRDIKGLMMKQLMMGQEQEQSQRTSSYVDFFMTGDYKSAFGDMGKRMFREADGRWMGNMGSLMAANLPMLMMMMKQNPFEAVKQGVQGMMNKFAGFDSADRITNAFENPQDVLSSGARKMSLSKNKYANFVGSALRVRDTPLEKVDTSQWGNRGRVFFDGITRQTIVEVIPTYLRKIVSSLTKQEEMVYNYNSGQFSTLTETKQVFEGSKPMMEESFKGTLAGLLKNNMDKKYVKSVDEKKLAEVSEVILKRVAEKMYTISDVIMMDYDQFKDNTGLDEKVLSEIEYNMLRQGLANAQSSASEDDARQFDKVDKVMSNYKREVSQFYQRMQQISRNTGMVNLINGSSKTNPFLGAALGAGGTDGANGELPKHMQDGYYNDLNVNIKKDKQADLSIFEERDEVTAGQKEEGRVIRVGGLGDQSVESINEYYRTLGLKAYGQNLLKGGANMTMVEKLKLDDSKIANDIRESNGFDINKGLDYKDNLAKMDKAEVAEMKRLEQVPDKIKEYNEKAAAIQSDGTLSPGEKNAKLRDLRESEFKDFPEVRGFLGFAMNDIGKQLDSSFGTEDGGKKAAKIGIGAIGSFLGLRYLKNHLPQAGIAGYVASAAGVGSVLAPIALGSLAIGGAIFANKDRIVKWMGAEEGTSLTQATREWLLGDGTEENKGKLGEAWGNTKEFFSKRWKSINEWALKFTWEPFVDRIKKPMDDMLSGVGDFWKTRIVGSFDGMKSSFNEKVFQPLSEGFKTYVFEPLGDAVKAVTSTIGGFFGRLMGGIGGFFKTLAGKGKSRGEQLREKMRDKGVSAYERVSKFGEFSEGVKNRFGTGYDIDAGLFHNKTKASEIEGGNFGMGYFYSQKDKKWGKINLGGAKDKAGSAELAGCGLMAMSMAVSNLKKDKITPEDIAPLARDYKVSNDGIAFGFFKATAEKYELKTNIFGREATSTKGLLATVNKGHQVIALIRTPKNTLHYILMEKGKGNTVKVSDPNDKKSKTRNASVMHAMVKTYIVVYKGEVEAGTEDSKMATPPKRKGGIFSKLKRAFRGAKEGADEAGMAMHDKADSAELANIGGDKAVGKAGGGGNKMLGQIIARSNMRLRDTVGSLKSEVKLTGKDIIRELKYSMNGVSYNLEYIKRLMAKKWGALSKKEAPDSTFVSSFFGNRKNGLAAKISNIFGSAKDRMFNRAFGIFTAINTAVEKVVDTVMKPFRFIGKVFTGIKKKFDGIVEKITKPFIFVKDFMIGAVKGMFGKDGYLAKFGSFIKGGIKDAFGAIIGTEGKPGLIRKGYRAIFGYGDQPGMIEKTITGVGKLAKGTYDLLVGSKDKPGALRLLGRAANNLVVSGLGALGSGLKTGYNLMTGKTLGFGMGRPKKVEVVGGHLDTIGALGALDMDALRDITKAGDNKAGKKESIKEKVHKQITRQGMRDSDKYQDIMQENATKKRIDNETGKGKEKDTKGMGAAILGTMGTVIPLVATVATSLFTNTELGKQIVSKVYDTMGVDGEANSERVRQQSTRGAFRLGWKALGKGVDITKNMGKGAKNLLGKVGTKFGGLMDNVILKSPKVAEVMTDPKGIMGGQIDNVLNAFKGKLDDGLAKILSSKAVTNVLGTKVAQSIVGLKKKIASKVTENIAKYGAKSGKNSLLRLGGVIPVIGQAIDAVFFAYDLTSGMVNAGKIFQVRPSDVTTGMRMVAGFVKAFQGWVFSKIKGLMSGMGAVIANIIPTEWIAQLIYKKIAGFFGDDNVAEELASKQQNAEAAFAEATKNYKEKTGEELDRKDFDSGKIDVNGEKVGFLKRTFRKTVGSKDKFEAGGIDGGGGASVTKDFGVPTANNPTAGGLTALSGGEEAMLAHTLKDARRHEGWRSKWYMDTTGHRTIGYGYNLEVAPASERRRLMRDGITREEGEKLLKKQLAGKWADLKKRIPWVSKLDPARQSVLLNMAFNMGVPGLMKWKNTLRAVKEGNYQEAYKQMMGSLWRRQVKGRAVELSNTMLSGNVSNIPDVAYAKDDGMVGDVVASAGKGAGLSKDDVKVNSAISNTGIDAVKATNSKTKASVAVASGYKSDISTSQASIVAANTPAQEIKVETDNTDVVHAMNRNSELLEAVVSLLGDKASKEIRGLNVANNVIGDRAKDVAADGIDAYVRNIVSSAKGV